MKWSQMLIPTSKEAPADAEIISHQLMIRAGYIRKLASGTYSYLPLGLRSLQKAAMIVRQEIDATGAQEILMPVLQPEALWQRTGRMASFGENLMRLKDRHGRVNVLGPTHEEVVTELAAHFISSYKQLPVCLYQIQTKFRDEFRPRFGVMRSREFLMKDAYSFHTSARSLDETYQGLYDAYCRIMERSGLPYTIVEAESGPIGGSASHEFMVPADSGEDVIVRTADNSYAANLERAEALPLEKGAGQPLADLQEVKTPNVSTIEQLTAFLQIEATALIKTLIYLGVREGQEDKVGLVALVRGDHEVNETKLARAAQVTAVELADEETVRQITGAKVGFAGPVGLDDGVALYCDQAVTVMQNAATGANRTDYHLTGVNPGRDFEVKQVTDIRYVTPADRSPIGQELIFSRGVEIGHVFKLGSKYSEALGATYLDEQGQSHPMIMGCYGVGVNRILAAAIEVSHDEFGIVWPISIAPFEVLVTAVNQDDPEVSQAAEQIYEQLRSKGVDVILDDRALRGGVKFKDADLIGVPVRVTVGKRGLAEGNVEIKLRREQDRELVRVAEATQRVQEMVKKLYAELTRSE